LLLKPLFGALQCRHHLRRHHKNTINEVDKI
jgi:hypothetical protein